jgi:hypothetical protein
VVLGVEHKLDGVTRLRVDCRGGVVEATIEADVDEPIRGENGSGKSGNGGRSESKTHFEGFVLWGVFRGETGLNTIKGSAGQFGRGFARTVGGRRA